MNHERGLSKLDHLKSYLIGDLTKVRDELMMLKSKCIKLEDKYEDYINNSFSEYVSWQELQNFHNWLGEDGLRQLDEYQFDRFSSLYAAYKADNDIKTKYDVQYTSDLKTREDWANIKAERLELFKQNLAELTSIYKNETILVNS